MTKKHFIELGARIRQFNNGTYHGFYNRAGEKFTKEQISVLADFCQSQNERFDRELWLGFIDGTRGPGGKYLEETK